jgi:hypothetical protein
VALHGDLGAGKTTFVKAIATAAGNVAVQFPAADVTLISGEATLDVAGVIQAVGDGTSGWKAGDAVYYHGDFTRPGGFAEYVCLPAENFLPIPAGLDYEAAAPATRQAWRRWCQEQPHGAAPFNTHAWVAWRKATADE